MKNKKNISIGMAMGIVFGSIVGVLTDNIGLWLALGIAIGAGIGSRKDDVNKKQEDQQG